MRVLNKVFLIVGGLLLVGVLLNPPIHAWVTYIASGGFKEHREIEYGRWIGEMLAVIVGTGISWYLSRKTVPRFQIRTLPPEW
jgi:uncharacterized membrane protein